MWAPIDILAPSPLENWGGSVRGNCKGVAREGKEEFEREL